MNARVGDHVLVRSSTIDRPSRDGEILEVHGPDGTPPFVVRWSDTDHESLVFPGPDAYVEHFGATANRRAGGSE